MSSSTNSSNHILSVAVVVAKFVLLLGTAEKAFKDTDILFDELTANIDKPVEFYVYNTDTDEVRVVVIMPSKDWGGEGILGAHAAHGYLHILPASCCTTIGNSNEGLVNKIMNSPFGQNDAAVSQIYNTSPVVNIANTPHNNFPNNHPHVEQQQTHVDVHSPAVAVGSSSAGAPSVTSPHVFTGAGGQVGGSGAHDPHSYLFKNDQLPASAANLTGLGGAYTPTPAAVTSPHFIHPHTMPTSGEYNGANSAANLGAQTPGTSSGSESGYVRVGPPHPSNNTVNSPQQGMFYNPSTMQQSH